MLLPKPVGQNLSRSRLEFLFHFFSGVVVDELAVLVVESGQYTAGMLIILSDTFAIGRAITGPVPAVTSHPTFFFP